MALWQSFRLTTRTERLDGAGIQAAIGEPFEAPDKIVAERKAREKYSGVDHVRALVSMQHDSPVPLREQWWKGEP